MPPACERFKAHEEATDALSFILVVIALRLARFSRDGHPCFADQLLAGLVQAHLWVTRIIWPRVDIQHLFHLADKGGIGLRRNTILLALPRLEFVFFRTCRTVSRPTRSTYPSSTSLSASNRMVQCTCPDGAGEHARAIRWASASPSSRRRRCPQGKRRSRAAVRLCSTKCWRTRPMVVVLTSSASLMCSSVQPGPSGLASALSKMRAWRSLRAAAFPAESIW